MDLLYVIFVLCSYGAHKAWAKQIHDDLRAAVATNREELIQFFDVDSIESVPEYDITLIRPQRTRRDIGENRRHYKLSAFDKDFQLELEPKDDVVSQTLVVMKKLPGNIWTQELYTPEGRFLQGQVVSGSHSHVAVRELQDAEMTGIFVIDDHMYKLHPINDRVKRILSLKGHGHHVITRRSIKDPKSDIFRQTKYPEPIRALDKENENHDEKPQGHQRVRRDLGKKYIETMMTMDKVSCDYYAKDNVTMDFILAVANMVNRMYRDESIGIDVTWMLTKIFLIKAYEEGLDVVKNNINSAVKYLHVFVAWGRKQNTPAGEVGHFDNGVLLSRKICGLNNCNLGGVAYSGYLCNPNMDFTVNNARGLDAAFYVAHEMAHNFGVTHDSGDCAKGYIMSSGQAYGPNSFQWSNCSRNEFKSLFSRAPCYDNIPPKNYTLPKLPPGYEFDQDRQCKFLNGPEYRLCPVTTSNCALLFCSKVGGCFTAAGTAPIDGTPCGNRKWCVSGYCVSVGTSLPPSVDGVWGAWGAYGACSRTCGGGVRHRTRLCNNPSPKHDGKSCPGSAIGEFEICNTQNCPSNAMHYRKFQCLAKSPSYVGYYIVAKTRCYLWCTTTTRAYGEGNVADGTKYIDDPHVLDICIAGKQVPVGCDHGIRSGKVKDRCMKCKGDGSTCNRTEGTYTKMWTKYGPNNADPMFVIPANSTKFFIKENSKTWNLLNLKLWPPESNSMVFGQRPLNSTRSVAGTIVRYDITNNGLNYAESLSFDGPNTKPLVPMFVYLARQANAGYTYSYYSPGRGSNTTFIWKTVLRGECSMTCAGGVRSQMVTCHRDDDKTRVDEEFCNITTQPNNTVSCNTQPCPARWEPEPWGACSSRCGGGNTRRLVPCLQQVTSSFYRTVESSYCNISIRPPQTEPCNEVDCGPEWVVGEWSECFESNRSQLISKRSVTCQNKLGNGTVISAKYKECTDVDTVVPESIKNCPTTVRPTTIRPTTQEEISTPRHTTTEPLEIDPGGTAASSLIVWLPTTLSLVIVFCLVLMLGLLYRGGYLACHKDKDEILGTKLEHISSVKV